MNDTSTQIQGRARGRGGSLGVGEGREEGHPWHKERPQDFHVAHPPHFPSSNPARGVSGEEGLRMTARGTRILGSPGRLKRRGTLRLQMQGRARPGLSPQLCPGACRRHPQNRPYSGLLPRPLSLHRLQHFLAEPLRLRDGDRLTPGPSGSQRSPRARPHLPEPGRPPASRLLLSR